jgi:hypothetical protein|nr:MAG TPA: hypothetical protein [Caudoviricetes sp.]
MYSIVFNGTEVNLPKYSFTIANKIEEIEISNNNASKKFKDKCNLMYKFESELIGKQQLSELIGDFNDCDPNDINLLYLSIVASYQKPIADYNSEATESKMNDANLSKLLEVLNVVSSISDSGILNGDNKVTFGR